MLQLDNSKDQPDANQSKRGTIFGRRWQSKSAQSIGEDAWETLSITRPEEQGEFSDEAIDFGLTVTLSVPGELKLYEQVHSMVRIRQRQRV